MGGFAFGWMALVALLFSLTSRNGGPWVNMTAYLRGCTEFWVLSMLLLASSRPKLPRGLACAGLMLGGMVIMVEIIIP